MTLSTAKIERPSLPRFCVLRALEPFFLNSSQLHKHSTVQNLPSLTPSAALHSLSFHFHTRSCQIDSLDQHVLFLRSKMLVPQNKLQSCENACHVLPALSRVQTSLLCLSSRPNRTRHTPHALLIDPFICYTETRLEQCPPFQFYPLGRLSRSYSPKFQYPGRKSSRNKTSP